VEVREPGIHLTLDSGDIATTVISAEITNRSFSLEGDDGIAIFNTSCP